MELSFSTRVMVQGVNAVVSEVPMSQFTATLRNLCPQTTWVLMILTISSECACCLFAVVFCMATWGKSDDDEVTRLSQYPCWPRGFGSRFPRWYTPSL